MGTLNFTQGERLSMYRRALVVVTVVILMGAAWVRAQEADAVGTRIQNATISGDFTTSGVTCTPVPDTGYPDICPSGTCSCITMSAAKVTGSMAGKGFAVVNFTVDGNSATSSVSGATCQPAFGQADITTTVGRGANKTVKTESINLLAALCDSKNGRSPSTLTGGWGIAASPAPSPAASGWGTLAGTQTGSKIRLQLQGAVTQ
jgi:hypothetical protein